MCRETGSQLQLVCLQVSSLACRVSEAKLIKDFASGHLRPKCWPASKPFSILPQQWSNFDLFVVKMFKFFALQSGTRIWLRFHLFPLFHSSIKIAPLMTQTTYPGLSFPVFCSPNKFDQTMSLTEYIWLTPDDSYTELNMTPASLS